METVATFGIVMATVAAITGFAFNFASRRADRRLRQHTLSMEVTQRQLARDLDRDKFNATLAFQMVTENNRNVSDEMHRKITQGI